MDNANLSKLIIKSSSKIILKPTPEFHENITNYDLVIQSDISFIEIEATTSDTGASYVLKNIQHDEQKCFLNDGLNAIMIEVASEDGTIKKYQINCKKLSVKDAYLRSINVNGVDLKPVFDSHVYEYYGLVSYKCSSVNFSISKDDSNCQVYYLNSNEPILEGNFKVNLHYGFTNAQIQVKSPDGSNSQIYKVLLKKEIVPRFIKFKNLDESVNYEDPISLQPLYCPVNLNDNINVYSLPFVEFYYAQSKRDFLTGSNVIVNKKNEWYEKRLEVESALAKCEVYCPLINGDQSDTRSLQDIGCLIDDFNKNDKIVWDKFVEVTQDEEPEISAIHKFEIRSWEKNLVTIYDETDPKKLMHECNKSLEIYLSMRNKHVHGTTYETDKSLLDYLNQCIHTCATAIKHDKNNAELHFKLATLLEEKHYLADIYGFKDEEEDRPASSNIAISANAIAKTTSKEEEINAICKLKNVSNDAPIELKIKALDDEYHYLIQNGQQQKAEHVESLYHFKVRQSVMNTSMSFRVSDSKMSLGQAYLKYLDALHLCQLAKSSTKYLHHFHVGRMFCLRSNYQDAIKHFKYCLNWKNDEYKKLVRFYLGYAMSLDKNTLENTYKEAVYYICNGLQMFLESSLLVNDLFALNLLTLFNTTFPQAFVNIGNIARTFSIKDFSFIKPDDSYHFCASICCQALNEIYLRADSIQNLNSTSEIIKQLNWLLVRAHSCLLDLKSIQKPLVNKTHLQKCCFYLSALLQNINKDNNSEIFSLQESICQKLVFINPCNSQFLYLLGNAQLEKYDNQYALNNEQAILLNDAKNSFLASIQLEGKLDNGEVLELVSNQNWWKKMNEKPAEPVQVSKSPTPAASVSKSPAPAALPKGSAHLSVKKETAPTKATPPVKSKLPQAKPQPVAKVPPATTKPTPQKKSSLTTTNNNKNCDHSDKKSSITEAPSKVVDVIEPIVAEQPKQEIEAVKTMGIINKKIPKSRIAIGRVFARLKDIQNAKVYYKQMIEIEPYNHDAYVELADLFKSNAQFKDAVDLYETFKYNEKVPSFDDAYIFGEIVNILMKNEFYDDARLVKYMVLWGRVLGIGILEKYIQKLDEKNKVKICRDVYCGINMKDPKDPDIQSFFKYKGWL